MGMLAGEGGEVLSTNYYKKDSDVQGVGNRTDIDGMEKTAEEMKSIEFIELLNQGNEDMWKQDLNNINNGYPILYWQ